MKKIYILVIAGISFLQASSQVVLPSGISTTENYVYAREYLDATTSSSAGVRQMQSVTYVDGLGRPMQKVDIKASPAQGDMVTKILYDALGRQERDYLPMPQQGSTNGSIYGSVSESVGAPLYGNVAPYYTQKEIEYSPLERPLSTTAPGPWGANGKKVKLQYNFNTSADKVKIYTTEQASWADGTTAAALKINGNYPSNRLYKNTATDEDGNIAIEFKNNQGQIVLVRKVLNATQNADTYYVYNEYHDLVYVLPPLFSEKNKNAATVLLSSAADLNELGYQYRYDRKNRLVEKKLPGKGLDPDTGIWHWDVVVYDNQDRPVMTQDGNLKKNNRWLFTKYDKFGRPAYTGTTDDSRPRSSIQGKLDSLGGNNTERTTGGTAYGSGVILLYDNLSSKNFPNSITELFSISYYDTYPAGSPPMPATILSQDVLQQNAQSSSVSTKGMPTASMVKNLGEAKWTKTYIWYDTRGRNIGTDGVNHLGGYTRIKTQLDFSGVPIETQTYHKRSSASSETTIAEYFTYDHQNRLARHEHSVNGATPEVLSDNTYNELGWLTIKKLGNSIEEIRYSYNVRGWMTGINLDSGGNFQAGKLFNYKINYNDPVKAADFPEPAVELKVRSRWNGNIAEVFWKNDQDADTKKYGFAYDGLDRLLVGVFRNPLNPGSMEHSEWPSYDLNGNILSLKRTSYVLDTAALVIDDLQYTYSGNRVTEIADDSQDGNGYEGGGNPIAYDANGNMADMKDKQINAINYNVLNLPEHMSIGSGKRKAAISHTYRADGVKLAKSYTHIGMGALGNMVTVTDVTDYLDGFQYLEVIAPLGRPAEPSGQDLEAAMEREAFTVEELAAIPPGGGNTENAVLQFVPTAEGFYSFTENRYIYQYKDHLGNVRVSFTKNQSGGTDVLDTNDYYPFGMNHLNPDQESFFGASSYKNYKFGGKELQETGFYDFGARFYMSDIAIFGTHDPMSEKTMQPYAYAYNNPMKFADPTGMEGEAANNDSVETGSGGQEDAGGFGGFEGPANGRGCPPNCPEFINKGKPIDIDEVVVTGKKNEGAAASSNSGTNFSFSNIGNSISNLWNSNFARGIVPDKITLSLSQSLTVYIGETTDISLNWITRGNDSQIIPYAIFTAGGHGGGRASADALVNIGAGTYLISDMRNLPKGQARDALLGWSAYGTASAGFVAGGSITGSVGFSGSPLISNPTWVSGAIGGGASIGGGITGGISYSYPVIKSQFK